MKKIILIFISLLLVSCGSGVDNNSKSILDTESTSGGGFGEPTTQEGTR